MCATAGNPLPENMTWADASDRHRVSQRSEVRPPTGLHYFRSEGTGG